MLNFIFNHLFKIVMKKFYLLIIAALLILSSCEENNDFYSESLDGTWILQKAICFCHFGDDFDFNQHKIIINHQKNSLEIQNSNETNFITTSGQYPLGVNGNELSIDKNQKFTFVQNDNSLTLTYVDNPMIADDEIVLEYIRAE